MNVSLDRNERLAFLGLDARSSQHLNDAWTLIEPHLEAVLDKFYNQLIAIPALRDKIGSTDNIPRLKAAQRQHWTRLFAGDFDDAYFEAVLRVGQAHERIGLEPRWYIAGYNNILCELVATISGAKGQSRDATAAMISATTKAVLLDVELGISTYYAAIKEEAEKTLNKHASDFKTNILGQIQGLGSAATELEATAQSMASVAETTSSKAVSVASATEEASANVQTVAAAAEELTRTIVDVTSRVTESNGITKGAVEEVRRTDQTVHALVEASGQIEEIVKLIKDIADQTNLLALNATIEAARAGEAGRGFAVVANEVKNLASQTGKATDDIAEQISSMRSSVDAAVTAIGSIGETISRVDEISTTVASTMDEQASATQEISGATQEAASGTQDVASNIGSVSQAASETGAAAEQVKASAAQLSTQANDIQQSVDDFLQRITGT